MNFPMLRQLLLVAFVLLPGAASAATFCAETANELRAAFDAAEDNGEIDDIRVAAGTYFALANNPFSMDITDGKAVRVTGGWQLLLNVCAFQNGATVSALDGIGLVPALRIRVFTEFTVVPVTVETLTLRNGFVSALDVSSASGLSIVGFAKGATQIHVDRVVVHNNRSDFDFMPAVRLASDGNFIRFANSIVRDNSTRDAAAVYVLANQGAAALHGLTVINNHRSGIGAAVDVLSETWAVFSNSLVWHNTGGSGDIEAAFHVRTENLRYGGAMGPLPNDTGSSPIVDPKLQSPTVPRPLINSPLRNAAPAFAGVSRADVYGKLRDLGGFADIGAAEYVE